MAFNDEVRYGLFPQPGGRQTVDPGFNMQQPKKPGPNTGTSPTRIYGDIGADADVLASGDESKFRTRIGKIAGNRDYDGIEFDKWIGRLKAGTHRFGDIRRAVDKNTGSSLQTALSAGVVEERPTELPSLSAEDFADLAARRRNATSSFEEVLARGAAGRGRAEEQFNLGLHRIRDVFSGEREGMLNSLGDRSLARQPRFAGKGLRNLRNEEASQTAQARTGLAGRLAEIEAEELAARNERERELAQIEADEVRRRSQLERLLSDFGG